MSWKLLAFFFAHALIKMFCSKVHGMYNGPIGTLMFVEIGTGWKSRPDWDDMFVFFGL